MKVPLPDQFSAIAWLCILALSCTCARACADNCEACTKNCEDAVSGSCFVVSLDAAHSAACGNALDYHFDCGYNSGADDDTDCKDFCGNDVACVDQVQLFSVLTACTWFHPRPARPLC